MNDRIHQYELLDFGDGRKLERFGDIFVDRPCPAAESVTKVQPELWRGVVGRYDGTRAGDGNWSPSVKQWVPTDWRYEHIGADGAPLFQLQIEALPSGQVGVFPEQRKNWDWIARQVRQAKPQAEAGRRLRILNLFAYTGASTLAAAAAGAEVVHIDAAQNIVDRARQNAELSGLVDRPIRWIAEDAVKFCRREQKRGNKYNAVILDPPSYGHGPKGEVWQIEKNLLPLLELCGELTSESRAFILVTCHSPGIGPAEVAAYLSDGIFGHCGQPPATGELFLETPDGRRLPSGVYARWPS
ncbi:MAG TPA: class I SAM-dependent methyltransferase [Lacipirellulaceae bacterium]|jgi:23S rRNA (cytosine1962-C5)-methyltransferase